MKSQKVGGVILSSFVTQLRVTFLSTATEK